MLTNSPPPIASRRTSARAPAIRPIFTVVSLFLQPVYGIDNHGNALQERVEQGHGFDLARLDAFFTNIQKLVAGLRVEAELFGGALDYLALLRGRVDAVEDERVAEQHAERRNGIQQQSAQQVGIGKHARSFLAQAEDFGAEVMLHLRAIKGIVDDQGSDDVEAEEQLVVALDVVELDGEAVSGGGHFVFSQQQRRRAALFAPPAEDVFAGAELAGSDFTEHAQDVVIGEMGGMVAGHGRAIEDHGDQTVAVGLL